MSGDCVADFLMKRQVARRHADAVEPNLEAVGLEVFVQASWKGSSSPRAYERKIVVMLSVPT